MKRGWTNGRVTMIGNIYREFATENRPEGLSAKLRLLGRSESGVGRRNDMPPDLVDTGRQIFPREVQLLRIVWVDRDLVNIDPIARSIRHGDAAERGLDLFGEPQGSGASLRRVEHRAVGIQLTGAGKLRS
jgi:hypothetical protein